MYPVDERQGIYCGSVCIDIFDNDGRLVVVPQYPVGDGQGGLTEQQKEMYIAALQGAIQDVRAQTRGKFKALLGMKDAPLPGLRNLG